ncbi:FMN-binding protein [Curtobacterium sp. KT1]|uniref:FMN-binding protein n=1 Tax=Curtobacterium sp. KT1 TaxID=3372858 RepID=UPI0037C0AE2D
MRTRVITGGVVSSLAVLVIGWQLGGQPAVTAPAEHATTSGSGTDSGGTSSSGSTGASSGPTGSAASGTFAGEAVQTRYGPVRVQITVASGKLTDVTALQLTDSDGRSVQISQQAAPILRQEALQAQSAQIQSVSGATFTSQGYTTSLQSAIDAAGL